jgi:hypothetical protein
MEELLMTVTKPYKDIKHSIIQRKIVKQASRINVVKTSKAADMPHLKADDAITTFATEQ